MIEFSLNPHIKISELKKAIEKLNDDAPETFAYHFVNTIERLCNTEVTILSDKYTGLEIIDLTPNAEVDDSFLDRMTDHITIMTKSDQVNHPPHYETNGIECFDAIKASQGDSAAVNFAVCNAFKYIWRNQHKENQIQDLEKAIWYLNKAVDILKDKEE